MVEILATHKRELENELRERVRAFFEENNETPESVSIDMQLDELGGNNGLSTIQILVKDASTGATLISV